MTDSALLLEIYRAARERETGEFEEFAIAAIKRRLFKFDSAIWGTGQMRADGGVTPHVVHLHEQPRESLQAWAALNVSDPVAKMCMAQPGLPIRFHAPTLFANKASSPMRAYAKRYGRQSYMVCGVHHPAHTDLLAWLSLYRHDPENLFTEEERCCYRDFMIHLNEAQEINRRLQLQRTPTPNEPNQVLAIADIQGYLHTPWPEIEELLLGEWFGSRSGRLPPPLLEALAASADGCYRGRTIIVRSRMISGLLFIRACRSKPVGSLSSREWQVANSIAHGMSAKQAARELGLSPATIRVHLQNIYLKLGVHSQAELGYVVASTDGRGSAEFAGNASVRATG